MTTTTPAALDQPLPDELAGRNQGWFTRYRRYPVFSRAWVLGRWRLWGPAWALAMLGLAGGVVMAPPGEQAWALLVVPALQTLLPMAVLPWLALAVRRQGWPPAREWRALVLLFALVCTLLAAVHRLDATEPLKQWLAEQAGLVDATGKRRKVQMAVGVSVRMPDTDTHPAAHPAAPATSARPKVSSTDWSQTAIWTLLGFWLGGGAALWGWRREQADLAALARERALRQALAARREAELQLSVLAAQVEPHFLFNTLAGVRSAIDSDPARASQLVDRLCDYLRATIPRLRSDGSAQATLGGQLDIVRAYLALMATRMPRLRFDVQMPTALLDRPFPPWLLITLAENAVKHGVEPKIGPAQVRVSAEATADGGLAVTVADDGVGFGGSTSGSGLGLANIRGRLQQMFGSQAGLHLAARPGGGVAATITLPPASAGDGSHGEPP
jgi:signal transduction histidine kinase